MIGVTHIQFQASLHFDDGFTVTLSSPVWKKDIRQGDYFPDEQIADILSSAGINMAELVEKRTALGLHNEIKLRKDNEGRPQFWRKPRWNEPFSAN